MEHMEDIDDDDTVDEGGESTYETQEACMRTYYITLYY